MSEEQHLEQLSKPAFWRQILSFGELRKITGRERNRRNWYIKKRQEGGGKRCYVMEPMALQDLYWLFDHEPDYVSYSHVIQEALRALAMARQAGQGMAMQYEAHLALEALEGLFPGFGRAELASLAIRYLHQEVLLGKDISVGGAAAGGGS